MPTHDLHDASARGRSGSPDRPRRCVSPPHSRLRLAVLTLLGAGALAAQRITPPIAAHADRPWTAPAGDTLVADSAGGRSAIVTTRSARDRATAARVLAAARTARGLRLVVSLEARELHVLSDDDTLLVAPVAIGRDSVLRFERTTWRFTTPLGIRRIQEKRANPVWIPPDWHYVEVAHQEGLQVKRLQRGRAVRLDEGERLEVRGEVAGIVRTGGEFDTLAEGEELIFGDTLFIPPHGTRNRRIAGQLGRYRFDMGNGYLLHGTPDTTSIGTAATHGCLRLHDGDLEWLYRHVPVGTKVYIH
jgi:hypothetical protein